MPSPSVGRGFRLSQTSLLSQETKVFGTACLLTRLIMPFFNNWPVQFWDLQLLPNHIPVRFSPGPAWSGIGSAGFAFVVRFEQ
jgi:hypothetical protein